MDRERDLERYRALALELGATDVVAFEPDEIVFEPRHQDRKAERIETGFMQRQIVLERRQGDLLFAGDLLHR